MKPDPSAEVHAQAAREGRSSTDPVAPFTTSFAARALVIETRTRVGQGTVGRTLADINEIVEEAGLSPREVEVVWDSHRGVLLQRRL